MRYHEPGLFIGFMLTVACSDAGSGGPASAEAVAGATMSARTNVAGMTALAGAGSGAVAKAAPPAAGASTPATAGMPASAQKPMAAGTSASAGTPAAGGTGGEAARMTMTTQSGAGAGGATAGAAGAAAAVGCADTRSRWLFCEDFEAYPAGPASAANGWQPVMDRGTLTIDGAHAQGKSALKLHTQGNGKAYLQLSPFTPPQNSFYGRMRVWAAAFPSAPDYAHFTLVEAAGTQPGVIRPIGGQYIPGKGTLWGPGSDAGPTGDWTNWKESAPATAGKWVCMEWQLAAANSQIQIWIDGQAQPDLTVDAKQHGGNKVDLTFPTFNSIWFGWWLYQGGSTPAEFDVWLDDIALSAERIGC